MLVLASQLLWIWESREMWICRRLSRFWANADSTHGPHVVAWKARQQELRPIDLTLSDPWPADALSLQPSCFLWNHILKLENRKYHDRFWTTTLRCRCQSFFAALRLKKIEFHPPFPPLINHWQTFPNCHRGNFWMKHRMIIYRIFWKGKVYMNESMAVEWRMVWLFGLLRPEHNLDRVLLIDTPAEHV